MSKDACLYEKISNDLKELISSEKLKFQDKIPSVSEIRQKYNVSHITALRGLKELASGNFVEFTKGRGYFVSYRKNRSNEKSTMTIGCIIRPLWKFNLADNVYNEIFCGMQREALRRRINLLQTYPTYLLDNQLTDKNGIEEIKKNIFEIAGMVDGFIIDDRVPDNVISECMGKISKPFVIIDRTSKLSIDTVTTDNAGGSSKAARTAIDMGYKRFIICKPGSLYTGSNPVDRPGFFINALVSNSITDFEIIDSCNMDPWDIVLKKILNLLGRRGTKTMIFCPEPACARFICDSLVERGFKFRENTGIMCFEATGYAKLREPHMASININTYGMGEKAVEILADRMNSINILSKKNHVMPISFDMGETI